MDIAVQTGPARLSTARISLHLNGAVILAAAVIAYARTGASWWLFAALLFAPDLSMLGYLANPRIGSWVYNAGHSLLIPGALIAAGVLVDAGGVVTAVGLIYAAHIGLDRMVGYGYKYPGSFGDTDLSRA